jgi:hypothetical protein
MIANFFNTIHFIDKIKFIIIYFITKENWNITYNFE